MVDLSNHILVAELQLMINQTLSQHLKKRAITITHTRFIDKKFLEDTFFYGVASRCQDLQGYLPLPYIAKQVGISTKSLEHRVLFMKKTNLNIFKYIIIFNRVFIYVGMDIINASKKLTAFPIRNWQKTEEYNVKEIHPLGDIYIGFY